MSQPDRTAGVLKNVGPGHVLTPEERSRGGQTSGAMKREAAKSMRQRLIEKAEEKAEDILDEILAAFRTAAADGDWRAAQGLLEQLSGKAPQSVELSGKGGEPIQVVEVPLASLEQARRVLEEAGVTGEAEAESVHPAHPDTPADRVPGA